ncbi:MAG: TonB-dependent receptor, partial [Alphaproteobacteria bacterium]|nr:TonB-dependent receptor [Alphaproteobacteria bacterium]
MDFKLVLSTALLASAIGLPTAHAEQSMQEIVVTATRYPRALSDIGSSISVITAADMAKSQTVFVQNMLQNIPGLSLNQNGAYGGVSSIRIRGASSAQTMVLIDGIQINDVSTPGGSYNFADLDPNGIERIEVLRGPQSILYGSDAIGGVINIITDSGRRG